MSRVIDISQWQGVIDWDTAKNHIDGAIIRCGWGSDYVGQDDTQFARNVSECERLRIPFGVYLYSYATSVDAAISEAKHALRLVSGHDLALPLYFDSEESGTEYNASAKAMAFCEEVRKAGYTPGVYASLSWWNSYLQGVSGVSKWCARWQASAPGMECDIWQYTSDGSVPGIIGRVDMNECYMEKGDNNMTEEQMDRIAIKVWEYIYKYGTPEQDETLKGKGLNLESNGYNVIRAAFSEAFDANKSIKELQNKIDDLNKKLDSSAPTSTENIVKNIANALIDAGKNILGE